MEGMQVLDDLGVRSSSAAGTRQATAISDGLQTEAQGGPGRLYKWAMLGWWAL